MRVVIIAFLVSILIAFMLPKRYKASARVMPPSSSSINTAMLAALAGRSYGALGGIGTLAGLFGMNNSSALFVDLLRSSAIADDLISRFDLQHVYHKHYRTDAAKYLARHTDVTDNKKSGVITITVDDTDPRRARDLAQGYLDQLNEGQFRVRYPDAIEGLIPIAAMPVPIQGRNLLWRRILSQAIRNDPEWKNGNYDKPPQGFLSIMPMFDMLVQSPARLADTITSYETADAHLADVLEETLEEDDANNILYRFESSFDFNPEPELGKIRAPLLTILFEDDELNPVNLGIMERVMPKVKSGRLVVIPTSKDTEGHRTQVKASVWREHVRRFMDTIAK